jgi:hypothetical protein
MDSYKSVKDSRKDLNGYILDEDLSNINHKVYYNKDKERGKRLLLTYRGTSNINDLGTDAYLAFGKLRDTKRFQESDDVFKQAKGKYNEDNALLTGHSMGSNLARAVARNGDKVITYNAGNGIFGSNFNTKTNDITNYRTSGDLASVIPSTKPTKTLRNRNFFKNILTNHSVRNLKNEDIRI